jgi:hypothetical protein
MTTPTQSFTDQLWAACESFKAEKGDYPGAIKITSAALHKLKSEVPPSKEWGLITYSLHGIPLQINDLIFTAFELVEAKEE